MHRTAAFRIMLSTMLLLAAQACSNRGFYEGFQASSRLRCMDLPLSQQDDCLERANTRYQDYERERSDLQKDAGH
jgi:hypothetical protein